jgi:hypothetical protein
MKLLIIQASVASLHFLHLTCNVLHGSLSHLSMKLKYTSWGLGLTTLR